MFIHRNKKHIFGINFVGPNHNHKNPSLGSMVGYQIYQHYYLFTFKILYG
jgi:hypothetical protein